MKIAVFGGTGRVGSALIQMAIEQGHTVQALVRNKEKAQEQIPEATHIKGDATNLSDISATIEGCDLVFSSLGTDKTTTLTESTPKIIQAMKEAGTTRIVTIGTAGILNSRYEEGKYRFQSSESKRTKTFAAEEHLKSYLELASSTLNWTVICPTYLPDGEEEGNIRYEVNYLPEDGKKISTQDTARFALEVLENNTFHHSRLGICY
ncbi:MULTISPECIES: NAD(P)-dependent oxidoreductase [Pontibacillus]|uniref:SDR family oxidoreductase n=1 Tax=Pontibacillus chungwhensis TaxID=265426 RepID=A0ABY8V2T2_9BACI|nr:MULTISPECIES: SDR family oxidoreductase [Pontibacillus]MCD5324931.1 SDR family oxidoreductase [Pontibacillus sp. HN14]WIF98890.1 SDR family oxidoreductase [Pontibacillus chungwhensis]